MTGRASVSAYYIACLDQGPDNPRAYDSRRDNNVSSPTLPQDPNLPRFTPESTHEVDPESEFEARDTTRASREIIGGADTRNIVAGSLM